MRQLAQDKTTQARDTVARGLANVQATTESAIDRAKEQIGGWNV
jgi:F0F1-type ATP synthase membrane subunit b/b'